MIGSGRTRKESEESSGNGWRRKFAVQIFGMTGGTLV
jgi:hypothetical protein